MTNDEKSNRVYYHPDSWERETGPDYPTEISIQGRSLTRSDSPRFMASGMDAIVLVSYGEYFKAGLDAPAFKPIIVYVEGIMEDITIRTAEAIYSSFESWKGMIKDEDVGAVSSRSAAEEVVRILESGEGLAPCVERVSFSPASGRVAVPR